MRYTGNNGIINYGTYYENIVINLTSQTIIVSPYFL